MFEQIATELFYQRAVRDHVALRLFGVAVIAYALCALELMSAPVAVLWAGVVLLAEGGIRLSRTMIFGRPGHPVSPRHAVRLLVAWAFLLAALYAAPSLLIFNRGPLGAGFAVSLSSTVVLTICAQHNLTPRMFYTSAPVPIAGLMAGLFALDGQGHILAMIILCVAIVANARNLQHANVVTFKGLVDGRLEAEQANVHMRQALVAAEDASAAKSTFLSTMSHEIRTPLNGVLGMAEVLALSRLDPESARAVAVIRDSGKALLTILNDVLDLSKIEAGHLELADAEFDLGHALEDIATLFAPSADEKGVRLEVEAARADGRYRGDPARVRQIISNLVSNAVKFTERGFVRIEAAEEACDRVRVTIRDTGIGMPEDQLGKVFERFTQADGSITRRFGGTGLGLSICRELCALMGGQITVASREGVGSTFSLVLPLARVGDRTAQPAGEVAADGGRGARVLCAEDNPTNQLVMSALLGQFGWDVTMADNGEDAVAAWRAQAWDVILMDMRMPVMDGLTAIRTIRAEEAAIGRPRTPIIALTADAMQNQVAEQQAAGADLHLSKPVETVALLRALSLALDADDGAAVAAA